MLRSVCQELSHRWGHSLLEMVTVRIPHASAAALINFCRIRSGCTLQPGLYQALTEVDVSLYRPFAQSRILGQ